MSSPKIEIALDPGPWTEPEFALHWPCRGRVSGRVCVETFERITPRAVRVSVGWRTEGRGDEDSEILLEETLHTGELPIGRREFPFAVQLPEAPISYVGNYIKIVWQVAAHIDLAWKRDPKDIKTFFVTLP